LIKKNILNKTDLFKRGHKYIVKEISNEFPEYLLKNVEKYKEFILD
tara:strand:+ start:357 stop:494 length:138 start_codon:yes stop_codon:yes gene_type:complete